MAGQSSKTNIDIYIKYRKRYEGKRDEAKLYWRMNRMGSASAVNVALRRKIDSLQAIPHRVSLVPTAIDPVYDENACEEVPAKPALALATLKMAKFARIVTANASNPNTLRFASATRILWT